MVLAGPGVVLDRAVAGLHALAAAGSLGVLNTWGAKGVFDWRSRHHLATAGLQARDFELGGVADADLVIATGIDPAEGARRRRPRRSSSRPARSTCWPSGGRGRSRRSRSRRCARGWRPSPRRAGPRRAARCSPTRVTRHYGVASTGGGLVAADPGVAGYWVARTFATTELGGVQVPSDAGAAGFAVACGIVARLRDPDRPVLAVVDGPVAPIVERVREVGRRLGRRRAGRGVAARRRARSTPTPTSPGSATSSPPGSGTVTLATDPTQLDRMVDVAGEVVAWGGFAALSGT